MGQNKSKSKKELIIIAAAVLAKNSIKKLYATTDGQLFVDKNRAELHKRNLGDKVSVVKITRDDVETAKKEEVKQPSSEFLKLGVSRQKDAVKKIETKVEIDDLITEEEDTQKRSSTIKLLQTQLQVITTSNTQNTGGDE